MWVWVVWILIAIEVVAVLVALATLYFSSNRRLGEIFSPGGAIAASLCAWWTTWAFITLNELTTHKFPVYLVIGSALGIIAIASFGGFFYFGGADLVARTRVAITAAFVLFYLALVSFLLVLPAFRQTLVSNEPSSSGGGAGGGGQPLLGAGGEDILRNFSWLVGTVVAFYFATSAVSEVAARRQSGRDESRQQERQVVEA